jgi:hypothetical protein
MLSSSQMMGFMIMTQTPSITKTMRMNLPPKRQKLCLKPNDIARVHPRLLKGLGLSMKAAPKNRTAA